jgi:hypothetical protein
LPILDAGEIKAKAFFAGISRVRPVKLEFYDHPFNCPLCNAAIVYMSMQTVIVHSQRKCPSCQGELQIHEGAVTEISDRKPPKHASLATAKRSRR